MTVILQNVNNDFVEVIKKFAKLDKNIVLKLENDLKYEKIINEFEKEKRLNKTKIYNDFSEFEKTINV